MTWYQVTWRQLMPGDIVQAPDRSEWTVGPIIECGDRTDYLISHDTRGAVWVTRTGSEPASAQRPRGDDTAAALAVLRAAFPLMERA